MQFCKIFTYTILEFILTLVKLRIIFIDFCHDVVYLMFNYG
jgi:hypothetical protein